MSNWTHVAAVFRIDDIDLLDIENRPDIDGVFGKECIWGEDFHAFCAERRKQLEHPEEYLPMGSEGSLHKTVWKNPDSSAAAHWTVTVWGDLRDHESVEEIEKWFRGCCDRLKDWIRQACCEIDNDLNGGKVISYRLGEETESRETKE